MRRVKDCIKIISENLDIVVLILSSIIMLYFKCEFISGVGTGILASGVVLLVQRLDARIKEKNQFKKLTLDFCIKFNTIETEWKKIESIDASVKKQVISNTIVPMLEQLNQSISLLKTYQWVLQYQEFNSLPLEGLKFSDNISYLRDICDEGDALPEHILSYTKACMVEANEIKQEIIKKSKKEK